VAGGPALDDAPQQNPHNSQNTAQQKNKTKHNYRTTHTTQNKAQDPKQKQNTVT
jgi:hypothetical protein